MMRPPQSVLPDTALAASRPGYLDAAPAPVRALFADAVDLRTFLAQRGDLRVADRRVIAQQALILLEQNYAHLPLKRAMHSVDPVQRLKLLLHGLERTDDAKAPSEVEFHREMTAIFTSVRDLHTNYLLPAPFNQMVAFVPFMVEDFTEGGETRYLVSHVMPSLSHPTFRPGVEIRYWNGMPIDRAIWANAQRYAGSNRAARHAHGVQTLTTRALIIAPPPDEEWVIVGYRHEGGDDELRFDWMVNRDPEGGAGNVGSAAAKSFASLGIDLEQHTIQKMRCALFKPQVMAAEGMAARKRQEGESFRPLESALPSVFEARPVQTAHGTFGYVRIRTFAHWPPDQFVNEFVRLISALPPTGLIIDVRGNGGGVITNGERILQTLTPRLIEPEPAQFLNTPVNLRICERHGRDSDWTDLTPWVDSMRQALQTGATYSAGFPISDPAECNALGQKYFGPVALIVDALCYSTTDIFAAGFQDHEIGPIVGIDGTTGAGGANVWTHQHLADFVLPGEDSVYLPLPRGTAMRVSIRRTLRVGKRAGTPVEDLGVIADEVHPLTRRDLLEGNVDLIARAASTLAGRPARELTVQIRVASPSSAGLSITSKAIDRVDVYVAGRPVRSIDVTDGHRRLSVSARAGELVAIQGYEKGVHVARWLSRV